MNTLSSGSGSGGAPGGHGSSSPGNNVGASDSTGSGGAGSSGGGSSNSGTSGSAIKKRRKSDTKPLSQINKCINEKRRREQVNFANGCC